jgi:hypothetical protein
MVGSARFAINCGMTNIREHLKAKLAKSEEAGKLQQAGKD